MTLDKCCCTFTLKTGTIIIGVVYMVLALLDGVSSIVILHQVEDWGKFRNAIMITRYIAWVCQVITFILSGLLIYGTLKHKEILLKVWVWYTGILFCVLGTIGVGYVLMAMAFKKMIEGIVTAILLVLLTGFVVHALQVVNSLRTDMMDTHHLPMVLAPRPDAPPAEKTNNMPPRYVPPLQTSKKPPPQPGFKSPATK